MVLPSHRFLALTPIDKQTTASITSPTLASILYKLVKNYNWIRQGYGYFSYVPDTSFDDDIEFRHMMDTCNSLPDRRVMKHLRFYSAKAKFDSIAMDKEFFEKNIDIMNVLHEQTNGEYFSTICHFKWDNDKHVPHWIIPEWFLRRRYCTIGNIIICIIDRIISMKYVYFQSRKLPEPSCHFMSTIDYLQPFWDKLTKSEKESIYISFAHNLDNLESRKGYENSSNYNYKLVMKIRDSCINGDSFIQNAVLVPAKHVRISSNIYNVLLDTVLEFYGKSVAKSLILEDNTMPIVKKTKPRKKKKPVPTIEKPQLPLVVVTPPVMVKAGKTKSTTDSSHSDNDHYKEKNKHRQKKRTKHIFIEKEENTISSKSKQEATNLFRQMIGDVKKHISSPPFSSAKPLKEKPVIQYWILDEEIKEEIERIDSYMRSLWPYRKLFLLVLSSKFTGNSSILSNLRYDLYGSIKTGLAVENSDMDIALSDPNITESSQMNDIFIQLQKQFQVDSYVHNMKYIDSARVPVLKLVFIII